MGTLQAIHLTGDNIVIEDATIAQAVMDDLMAGNVTAAMIYTDFIKIGSKDGALSIDGATMQIKDQNGTVRVQIGKDASGNFSYYLWDAAGKLIWSPDGITAAGVPDGLIVDSMVAQDAAIDGSKLNIKSVAKELTDDGTLSVDASHVVMDDTTLEANYKTMTKQIGDNAEATQTLQTEFKEVQGKIESKVWQSDITEAVTPLGSSITELSDKYTSQQQTIEGITTEIGDVQTSLESKADGSTVQALTGRVNKVEETATGFSRTISEIKTEVQGSVTDVAVFYALNNSETVPPADDDPGWSLEAPEWTEGMFMWQKTVTTYASGNKKTSSPTCLSGAVGADGEAAALLRIDSSRGTVFKNTGVSTVLTVTIYYGSQRINTSEQMKAVFGTASRLEWEWQRMDEDRYGVISADDSRLSDGGFIFTLGANDVDTKVTFRCNLIIE